MKLLVGCPVRNRAYVLLSWFHYVRNACAEIDVEPHFAFVYGTSDDRTRDLLDVENATIVTSHEENPYVDHNWGNNIDRYARMCELRNRLLDVARKAEAEYFLSLDSDILIAPGVLPNLFETIETCDAVGGKLFMTETNRFNPSYAMINHVNGGLQRQDQEGVFPVDVIMALKLMTPAAYNVDYVPHFQGEDVGWSVACKNERIALKWDGRIASKHIIIPEMLAEVDQRVGY